MLMPQLPSLRRPNWAAFLSWAVILAFGPAAFGQALPPAGGSGRQVHAAARLVVPDGVSQGQVQVSVQIAPGWHIYGLSQPPGGPLRTTIALESSPQFQLAGDWSAVPAPRVYFDDEVFKLDIHEHQGTVTFVAPVKISPQADTASLTVRGHLRGQVCSEEQCLTLDVPFTAAREPGELLAAAAASGPSAAVGEFRQDKSGVTLRGFAEPAVVQPGQRVRLTLTAIPDEYHYLYALQDRLTDPTTRPVMIVVTSPPEWSAAAPQTVTPPVNKEFDGGGQTVTKPIHPAAATWTIDVTVPAEAAPGRYDLTGLIGYQACYEIPQSDGKVKVGCLPAYGAAFVAPVEVGPLPSEGHVSLTFSPERYLAAAKAAEARSAAGDGAAVPALDLGSLKIRAGADQNVLLILSMAFLAGFLLNFMPCVLPVIGLKILSFVHQAGEHRARVFVLNVWYSIGLLSVFLILATLAVFAGLGWGQQFSNEVFNIVLTAVVFAFALSFLGVWEIPIPGFVGSSAASDLTNREGAVGALLKGALTTVLATPCSGPLLVPALAWAVKQPAPLTYATFGMVGLGMAAPYLVIGAFPRLIGFLPKPGAWMDTFKHIMGFILLATVVWLLSFIPIPYVVPTVAFLMALWAGCWWVGRVPLYEPVSKQLRAWAQGAAVAALAGWISFGWLHGVMVSRFEEAAMRLASQRGSEVQVTATANGTELPWRPFSPELLQQLVAEGKTVMIDFTADWCWTCKTNKKVAMNVESVKKVVEAHGVVPLKADKTYDAPEVDTLLRALGNEAAGIPFLAIFPAGNPNEPILLDGILTPGMVLEALQQAGPSRETAVTGTQQAHIEASVLRMP